MEAAACGSSQETKRLRFEHVYDVFVVCSLFGLRLDLLGSSQRRSESGPAETHSDWLREAGWHLPLNSCLEARYGVLSSIRRKET